MKVNLRVYQTSKSKVFYSHLTGGMRNLTFKPVNPIKRDWMKKSRLEKKLSVREIAELLGISHQHYNDIENGNRNPGIELAIKMSDFFKAPVLKFLKDRTRFHTERLEKI